MIDSCGFLFLYPKPTAQKIGVRPKFPIAAITL
jgi:hypothetical protein